MPRSECAGGRPWRDRPTHGDEGKIRPGQLKLKELTLESLTVANAVWTFRSYPPLPLLSVPAKRNYPNQCAVQECNHVSNIGNLDLPTENWFGVSDALVANEREYQVYQDRLTTGTPRRGGSFCSLLWRR